MKFVFYCLTIALSLFVSCSQRVSVSKFGAFPDDGLNDFEALKAATDYCHKNGVKQLYFPPGTYDIINDEALRIEEEAISGVYGEDVQGVLFRPEAPYVKALDLSGCKDLSVKADDARLLLQGWYEVVSIVGSEDITIEGLTIQYKRLPSTACRITHCAEAYFDAVIDTSRYYYIDSTITGRLHFYDNERERLYTGGCDEKILIAPDTVRFISDMPVKVGDYAILRHSGHYRAAVFIKECQRVGLKNVKIHGQPGMGVVGHLSKDISIDGLQVVPQEGEFISTNTDATHFTSCSGTISLRSCSFRGQGDDCTNIHNYYYHFYPVDERSAEIRIEGADLHALSLDYPSPGDTILVVSRSDMHCEGSYIVEKVDTSFANWRVCVQFDRPLELDKPELYFMTNYTRFPRVEILNNSVESHLARAFLVKSRYVHIAGNKIHQSVGTAIKLGAELSWHESGPAENVIVEDNLIEGCGYGGGFDATCLTLSTEAPQTPPYLNRRLIIRNNTFISDFPERSVVLRDAEQVILEANQVAVKDYVLQYNTRNVVVR